MYNKNFTDQTKTFYNWFIKHKEELTYNGSQYLITKEQLEEFHDELQPKLATAKGQDVEDIAKALASLTDVLENMPDDGRFYYVGDE